MPGAIPGKTSLWSRVVNLERNKADASTLSGVAGDNINRRLADHDESIEALSETVDQLSTCKCEAGAGMLKRIQVIETNTNIDDSISNIHARKIAELEKIVYNSLFSKIVMEEYAENIKKLVRDVDALQIRLSRAQDTIAEMQRDSRILKSPEYKKEIAAQKQDAKSKKAK